AQHRRAPCRFALGPAAASRRLDSHDVAGRELPRHLRRLFLAVDERAAACAVGPAGRAAGSVSTAFGEHREPAVLEDAQLANDAVAPAVGARATRAVTQVPPLDAEGVRELERLDR